MPFPHLSSAQSDSKDVKKHILSYLNHTLPLFRMSQVSKESNGLVSSFLKEMPGEFKDSTHAKKLWETNTDKTVRLYMRSPEFLNKVRTYRDSEARDTFICNTIFELAQKISDSHARVGSVAGSHTTFDDKAATVVKKLLVAAARFGVTPEQMLDLGSTSLRIYSSLGMEIASQIGLMKEKIKVLSLGIPAADFEGLSLIQVKGLTAGLSREEVQTIEGSVLAQQLHFWDNNIPAFRQVLAGCKAGKEANKTLQPHL